MNDKELLDAAYDEAQKGLSQGGLPIGSVLADREGHILARGHNLRFQTRDVTAHAETVCIRQAGIRDDWHELTLVSTLSPCIMCSGTALLFKIPRIIIGENITFLGAEHLFQDAGVAISNLNDDRCIEMMAAFIQSNRPMWWGDIGIPPARQEVEYEEWRKMIEEKGYGRFLL
ncbi:MAG: nucleoside deaminase [Phycisphaeraceae bacterium]